MDNKYYHRGSGEVVEPENGKEDTLVFFGAYLKSLPAIGKMEIPDYPVGWVGDDVEMVWQVMSKKSAETMNGIWLDCSKETYDDYLKGNVDRRILFLPVNKVTIKSESHVDLSGVDRQQSAAEIDRLRGEVRKLRDGLGDCDTLLAHLEDHTHGDDGKMITQQRGKIQQLLTETEG